MALNFSHRPVFPAAGCGLEGSSEDRFCNHLLSDGDVKDCFDYGRDMCKSGGCSQESISNDILDLLPSDPFGMEISTTFTAITGWLEDLEMDYGGYGCDMVGENNEDYQLFAGLNFLWNNAMKFQTFPGPIGFDSKSSLAGGIGGYYGAARGSCDFGLGQRNELCGRPRTDDGRVKSACLGFESAQAGGFGSTGGVEVSFNDGEIGLGQQMKEVGNASCSTGIQSLGGYDICSAESHGSFVTERTQTSSCQKSSVGTCSNGNGMPHAALNFAFSYLGVRDLLSVEGVCRSLRAVVQSDTLLWRNIHIGQPLNEKITDDILLKLTNRAQGHLQCLSLIECTRITDDGLKHVLLSNPRISKLCVPGCTRLSISGIIETLKMSKSMGTLRVKHLRIGGLYGVTLEHFEELKQLLGMDSDGPPNVHKPHFYNRGNLYLSCDDDRTIDIEMCPRCQKMRLVYDCPAEVCQGKKHGAAQVCRACTLCIVRCVQCGRCINDGEYEETFCLEVLCSDCSLEQRLKCQQMQVEEGDSSNSPIMNEPQDGVSHSG
ncbi:F-box protein SKIP14 [Punica granatum]|uniref:F-box domain-containing protein n=2 Tax=Punica granatum TaxID=22663 RepID=A0A218WTL1_PUNGR|nr:F-box protein SKIP14 [Punica granatum]OWM76184.1 hypothetical protein CDL15_Pgr009830 [Punica granatum]PKI77039.1 hypothetical protein CRG98_002542 [Punica granatum]